LDEVKILLDTNFLLTMVRHKIHGFEDIRGKVPAKFFVLTRVLWEMDVKSKDDKKIRNETRIVKQILKNNEVIEINSKMENVDTELMEMSKEYVIATNDKELRERIKSFGGQSIYIRSLSFIELEDIFD
jgi:rRNA-processing protein FCF1